MDHRVKGGTPPATALVPASALEGPDPAEKSRNEGDNVLPGKKEDERRGAGRKKEGDKVDVLELHIEGRCGRAVQQEFAMSGKDAGSPDGSVRVRNGLQTKRTKKPPKILESYVCKPTIRTYQKQGKSGLLRSNVEGRTGLQSKSSCAVDDVNKDMDTLYGKSKKTGTAAPPVSYSSSSPKLSSAFSPEPVPGSVPSASQGTKNTKQVHTKVFEKNEESLNALSERLKKEKLPNVNGQPVSVGHKPCSPPAAEQTPPSSLSTPCIQAVSAHESRNVGTNSKDSNSSVSTEKQKKVEKSSPKTHATSAPSKHKAGKHSVSSATFSTDPPSSSQIFAGPYKELSGKGRSDSSLRQPVNTNSHYSPMTELSPAQSQGQDLSEQLPPRRKKDKDRKSKKERQRDKILKQDRLELERGKSESRRDEVKKKKKEKGKDGKLKHIKGVEDFWKDDQGTAQRKAEDSGEHLKQKTEDSAMFEEMVGGTKPDKNIKPVNPGKLEDRDRVDNICMTVRQAESVMAGDNGKLREQDISRHSNVSKTHFTSAPSSLPTSSVQAPVHLSSSPQEQDSRPLKKRKARRPSWTKLVHRTSRAESQEALSDSPRNPSLAFSQVTKTSLPSKSADQQNDESHASPSSSLSNNSSSSSSAVHHSASKPSPPTLDVGPSPSRLAPNSVRKRGRPRSHGSRLELPPRLSPNNILMEMALHERNEVQKAPVLEPSPPLQCSPLSKSSPKKRGRPPKQSHSVEQRGEVLNHTGRSKDFYPPDMGSRQLKIRKLINEMKRQKRRYHQLMPSGLAGREGRAEELADGKASLRMYKSIEAKAVNTLSALSTSFGSNMAPQINVSKRGTIYMGKRRGRKPKSQTVSSQASAQLSFFANPSETSLFSSNQLQLATSHPFPSPSLTHSSGAHSPYSEGSLTEPTSSLLFSHPFSLPSPSSSCASSRPASSSSLSPFVKKSCPCQGRHHFPFHQSSCKLSGTALASHHTPGSPGQLKEATPSPRSESHSEETLPSDSGIGTDNNSISERGEMASTRGMLRLGQGSGLTLGGQRLSSSQMERAFHISPPPSYSNRHTNPTGSSNIMDQHKDRHRHRRREYDCSPSCTCMHSCPYPSLNKCTPSNYFHYLGHNALKRQKNKHKKKHQQLHMQDPEFLAELDDVTAQLSDVHIGRRSWSRASLMQGFDLPVGARKHHSSPHSLRSNIFRINLNGFYSPHPSSFSAAPSFAAQPFYPCHCNRKLDRRQCGCPSKFQETINSMGYYGSYPAAAPPLYHHLPSTFPLPPPHQYQPHHAHFFLNPARFHRRRSHFLKEGVLGTDGEGDLSRSGAGGGSSGFTSALSCGCEGSNTKHKHRHRHCERDLDDEEDLQEDEEEDAVSRGGSASSKTRSGFVLRQGVVSRKDVREPRGMVSKETPWLRQNGSGPISSTALPSSSTAAEKYKHMSLTSLGLGSSHLSSFGGGWGGLGQNLTSFGSPARPGFGNSGLSWKSFSTDKSAGRLLESDGEDDDGEDVDESRLYGASSPPPHTNLFTSVAMASEGSSLRSGFGHKHPVGEERSGRKNEPAWTERRDTGLQGDSRSRGQPKRAPTPDGGAVKYKRGPGRPRKHPLPSATPSPTHSCATPSMSPSDRLPPRSYHRDEREAGKRRREMVSEGGGGAGGGGHAKQQVTQLEMYEKRKKGRKRKHSDSPCRQSVDSNQPECDALPECLSPSDVEQNLFQTEASKRRERSDSPPRKTFLTAGLYSNDYKTADPPSAVHQLQGDSPVYTPGEKEYPLLPAPIHVGKYLRLKRIHFQLPYDVMWLWEHNQLCRQPAVPLKRKRHYSRFRERTFSSKHGGEENFTDFTSLFPHLDLEPLTSSERSFIMKHHVFLVRNWELVRDRQIRIRIERDREREEDGEESDGDGDAASGDDSHIKSDHSVGVEVTVISGDHHRQNQDTSSSLTASCCLNNARNRREEDEGKKRGETRSREQRRRRLNDLLLTLQRS